jgi:multicomponent Na+:H+ antiporter subunit D
MPVTAICGIIGALAISSFPLTSGFVSKSMISQAAADGHLLYVWMLLAAASAGVFLHAGIKFPWFVFFQKDSGLRPPDPSWHMRWAMYFFSFLCIAMGVWPEPLYRLLPYQVQYEPYTAAHVLTQLQLLLFSGLAFFAMLGLLKRTPTITLDVDWTYRVLFARLTSLATRLVRGAIGVVSRVVATVHQRAAGLIERECTPRGLLVRPRSTTYMASWVMVMLVGYLLLYYL